MFGIVNFGMVDRSLEKAQTDASSQIRDFSFASI